MFGGSGEICFLEKMNEEDYYRLYPAKAFSPYLILQQFTGFKDKNGKEIYEGDIVQLGWSTSDVHWAGLLATVVWWFNGFYFQCQHKNLAQDTYYQAKNCQVVGNVCNRKIRA